jgi:hypothetical protein
MKTLLNKSDKNQVTEFNSLLIDMISEILTVLELYNELAKYVLKEQGGDIEDVLDRNTMCVNFCSSDNRRG